MPEMVTDEEFLASWYVHLLGHEIQSVSITPNTVDAIIRKGLLLAFSIILDMPCILSYRVGQLK